MDINWHSGIFINGIEEPTYGHYGGLSFSQSGTLPIDALDALFKTHDESDGGIRADRDLLNGMVNLTDNQLGAEGHLYAGVAELAMIGELAREGYFSPFEFARGTAEAIHDIQLGFAGLSPAETGLALNWAAQSAWQLLI